MRKFLFVFIFLISFVSLSFSDMVRIPDGDYAFKTNNGDTVIVMTYGDKMSMLFKDITVRFQLKVDKESKGYYYYSNKNKIFIIFDSIYSCIMTTQRENYKLNNLHYCN